MKDAPAEGRRLSRGRRGRGRHRKRRSTPPPLHQPRDQQASPPTGSDLVREPQEPNAPEAAEEIPSEEPESAPAEHLAEFRTEEPVTEEAESAGPTVHHEEPPGPATLQGAIDQVNTIVVTLRESLDQMEELLELLEVFERQTAADQREIDSLRRSLRQLHRPREGGHGHHR